MTFHFIPGIWLDHYGLEMSESFRVTNTGVEMFTNYPRELLIQSPFKMPDGSDGIIS